MYYAQESLFEQHLELQARQAGQGAAGLPTLRIILRAFEPKPLAVHLVHTVQSLVPRKMGRFSTYLRRG